MSNDVKAKYRLSTLKTPIRSIDFCHAAKPAIKRTWMQLTIYSLIPFCSLTQPLLNLMPIQVRDESPSDIAAIHALTVAAFLHAPHSDHTEHFIVDALRQAAALSISLVAIENNSILGHVAVSPVTISDGSRHWYGLGPISVQPSWQKQGIGSQLMHAALQRLHEKSAAGCVLLGDPAYYARFGFKPEARLQLPDVPAEYFQALAFSAHLPHGIVTYHAAFNRQR